jgi:hypothetical protein
MAYTYVHTLLMIMIFMIFRAHNVGVQNNKVNGFDTDINIALTNNNKDDAYTLCAWLEHDCLPTK